VEENRAVPDVTRVLVATDGSETAQRAVAWAADLAGRYEAALVLLRVVVPRNPSATVAGAAEATQVAYEIDDLRREAEELAGTRGEARVVVHANPSVAIVAAAEDAAADVIVVGNRGMSGRKEFLLDNVPNRISHNARCTVVIVNTASG
jgi:nucleotide-binding universal stress UspA family protein